MTDLLHPSELPSVDRLLQDKHFIDLAERFGRDSVVTQLRLQLETARQTLVATQSYATTTTDKLGNAHDGDELQGDKLNGCVTTDTCLQQETLIEHFHTLVSDNLAHEHNAMQ